jgi:trimeric autotransporter adhesin
MLPKLPDMKTRIPPVPITIALICFALVQNTQAVNPAPDGGYPGGNTAEGTNALLNLTTGINNTAIGSEALRHDTTGSNNAALGAGALQSLTTGVQNTATGAEALRNNTANNNTADGFQALVANTIGTENAATGWRALFENTTGIENTANGSQALHRNTTGSFNTAVGFEALVANTIGTENAATGWRALFENTTGTENTANGSQALHKNTTGSFNTAVGFDALYNNLSGHYNVALGINAGHGVTAASNVICIGAGMEGANVDNSCYISNIYAEGIGEPFMLVAVDSTGKLGTASSSRRFKHNIKPMDKASDSVLALKPVTFQYKSDKTNTPQFGLVAEEVAAVNPDLVVRDKNGEIYSVRYDQVNAMLLNEFLKEHRKVQELEATVASLVATVKEQASEIQKVSAQLELSKATPQTVLNNQ